MIKIKGEGEHKIRLSKAGAAAAATSIDYVAAPYNGFIKAVYANFGLIGTDGTGAPTQDVIVDVMKNGTSIFSGATKINWAHAGQTGGANTPSNASSYGALTANPTSVTKGDKIRIDITQILNGTAPTQPSDLTVFIVFAKQKAQSQPASMLTGQVDENN